MKKIAALSAYASMLTALAWARIIETLRGKKGD